MESIPNFRDFGGYPAGDGRYVRRGLLYRSGGLAQASQNDLRALQALGIRLVCDLRMTSERRANPDRTQQDQRIQGELPAAQAIANIHIPIHAMQRSIWGFLGQVALMWLGQRAAQGKSLGLVKDYDEFARRAYRQYVRNDRLEFARVIRLLLDERNLPVVIHCSAGKDRTGLASGLILLSLGVSPEQVIQDYLLSNEGLQSYRQAVLNHRRLQKIGRFIPLEVLAQKLQPLFDARRGYIEGAFEQMRADFGSIENYLSRGLEITPEERQRLGDLLLEEK